MPIFTLPISAIGPPSEITELRTNILSDDLAPRASALVK
jgi:hypothetical protein